MRELTTYRITWVAIALLFAGCSTTRDPLPNKSTNWLRECTSDRMCSDGLACLCGVCTKTCGRTADCGGEPATTLCSAVSRAALSNQCTPGSVGNAEAICVAACTGNGDCKSNSGDFECRDQVCVVRVGAGAMDEDAGRDASTPMMDAGRTIPICDLPGGCDGGDGSDAGDAGDGGAGGYTCSPDSGECEAPCTVECKAGQMCLGNACADVLASDQPLPGSMALDASRIYWTNVGSRDDLGNYRNDGAIQAVSRQGGEVTTLASKRVFPAGLVVNSTHAYWLEGPNNFDYADSKNLVNDNEVWRVPLTGGDPERLVSAAALTTRDLAVDERYLYLLVEEPVVTDSGPFRAGPGAVYRMPNDGSAALERLFSVDYSYGTSLFVDDTALCWVGADPSSAIGQVGTASKDGSDAHVLSKTNPDWALMAVDASTIYWMGKDTGSINSIPRAGGDTRVLKQSNWQDPEAIVVDRDYVYSAHQESRSRRILSIERTDKLLSTSEVWLRSPELWELELAVDDDAIYILTQGSGVSDGAVLRVVKQ